VVERVAARSRIDWDADAYEGRLGRGRIAGDEVALLLPDTFMNASGAAVAQAVRGLGIGDVARDLLVVFDDADLPLGRLRLRARGGAGGHRGLADVLERIDCEDVPRLRFGIGRPALPVDTVDWVLSRFTREEEPVVRESVERAAAAVECFVAEGIECAMNRFNAAA